MSTLVCHVCHPTSSTDGVDNNATTLIGLDVSPTYSRTLEP